MTVCLSATLDELQHIMALSPSLHGKPARALEKEQAQARASLVLSLSHRGSSWPEDTDTPQTRGALLDKLAGSYRVVFLYPLLYCLFLF